MSRFLSIVCYLMMNSFHLFVVLGVLTGSAFAQTSQYDRGTPPQLSTGIQPLGSYSLTDLDTIGLTNGNLNVSIPLLTLGGRGGLTMPIVLAYNSKVWSNDRNVDTYYPDNPPVVFAAQYKLSDSADWRVVAAPSLKWTLVRITPRTHPDNGISLGWALALSKLTLELPGGGEITFRDDLTDGQPLAAQDPFPNDPYEFYSQDDQRGNTWHSVDGTGAIYISDLPNGAARGQLAGWVILADGTRYRFNGSSEPSTLTPDTQRTGWFEYAIDRNGNKITATANGYQDQLGRTVTIQTNVPDPANPSVNVHILITVNGYGGTPRYYKIYRTVMSSAYRSDYNPTLPVVSGDYDPFFRSWTPYPGPPHTTLFPNSWFGGRVIVSDEYVTSQLTLPDNRSFVFRYNIYGELAEITNPLGGKVRYEYDTTNALPAGASLPSEGGPQIPDRVVTRRTTFPDGQNAEAFYSYNYSSSLTEVKVCQGAVCGNGGATLLRWERHQYLPGQRYLAYGSGESAEGTGYSLWSTGLEQRTEILNTNGVVIQASENDWVQRAPVGFVYGNPSEQPPNDNRVTQTRSYLDNGSFAKTELSYDTDPQRLRANNVTESKEYDFGQSTPTRRTVTTYLKNNPDNGYLDYTTNAVHLLRLPTQQSVYEGATEKARTVYKYDKYVNDAHNATLADPGTATGHDAAYGTGKTTRGNATGVERWLNPGNTTLYSYSRYDKLGNVVSVKDPNEKISTISYTDNFGDGNNPDSGASGAYGATFALPTLLTSPAPNAGEAQHTARSQYDFSTGLLTGFKDRNGVITKTEYNDPFNRPTKVIAAKGGAASETQTQTYYAPQTVLGITLNKSDVLAVSDRDTVGDQVLRNWTLTDGFGRTIESWTRHPQGDVKVLTVYDGLGRAKQVSNPYRIGETPLYTTTTYDLAGRVTAVTTPDGATVGTAYDGAQVRVTDQAGKQRLSETDGLGRLRKVWEVTSAGTDAVVFAGTNYNGYLTQYSYDVLDDLTTVLQGGQTRTFVYDSLKRLTSATNPESGLTSYQYDGNGNLRFKTDARAITTEIQYDALNRAKSKSYSDGTPAVSYRYDNQTIQLAGFQRGFATGRLVAVNYGGGSQGDYFGYDELGRVVRKTQQIGSTAYPITATYNRAGAMLSENYPSNRIVNYSYDTAGRLASFTGYLGDGGFRSYATGVQYNAAGQMTQETFGTSQSLIHRLSYNNRHQLYNIKLGTGMGVNGSDNRGRLTFYYGTNHVSTGDDGANNNGNVYRADHMAPLDDSINNSVASLCYYGYDDLNRLSSVDELPIASWVGNNSIGWLPQSYAQRYKYDRYGNRTINTVATWGININRKAFDASTVNNRLSVPAGQAGALTYDPAGNLTDDTYTGAGTRVYDAENRMTSAAGTGNPGTNTFVYDGDGKRVRRIVNGAETWQIYGIGGELLAEYPVNGPVGSPQKEYGYRGGQLLLVYDSMESGDKRWQWLVADQLGTPRMMADLSGSLSGMRRHDYLPFGEELFASTGVRGTNSGYFASDKVRQQFGGYERDDETGLDFAGARYYGPAIGRFSSADPIALTVERLYDPQQINLYTYCRNNPLAFVDPNGETITFANDEAKKRYEEYLKFLNNDPKKYASQLATATRLQNSEVEYRLAVGGSFSEGAEGNLMTDGQRVLVNISNVGGSSGETFSLNSRFAHELEHARQFDNGELAFVKSPKTGQYVPSPTSYDIGDEVKAWQAQQGAAIATDYFTRQGGTIRASSLREFSNAKTDDERAGVLARNGYPNRNPNRDSNVVFGSDSGYKPGQLIRPTEANNYFFGRVNKVFERRR